jgi:hypothetical protein
MLLLETKIDFFPLLHVFQLKVGCNGAVPSKGIPFVELWLTCSVKEQYLFKPNIALASFFEISLPKHSH